MFDDYDKQGLRRIMRESEVSSVSDAGLSCLKIRTRALSAFFALKAALLRRFGLRECGGVTLSVVIIRINGC